MNGKHVIKYGLIIILGIIVNLAILSVIIKLLAQPTHFGLPLISSQVAMLTKAGEDGDIEACWALYIYYVEDEKKELYWLQKAVNYGDPRAKTYLADRLLMQDGRDKSKALVLLNEAAEKNYADAQDQLGEFYKEGKYVNADLSKAEYWLRRAANNGRTLSMINLAELLTTTHADYKAFVEAYKWTLISLMRVEEKSVYAKDTRTAVIIQKAGKLGFNVDKINREAELQAIKAEKNIPIYLNVVEKDNIILQNIRTKFEKK